MRELARQDGFDASYVKKLLNLTTLAPGILAAILDDTLPHHVRLEALAINPPLLWDL